MNVTFLVGWAFSVAASANMPSLAMLLFGRARPKQGDHRGHLGRHDLVAHLGLVERRRVQRRLRTLPGQALVPFSQPGIVTIPLDLRR